MSALLQELAKSGVDRTLDTLMASSEAAFAKSELENMFLDHGALSSGQLVDRLLHFNVLQAVGDRFGLSQYGRKVSLLVGAINGADVEDVFRRIRRIDGSEFGYDLVQQGMTSLFFDSLLEKPGFHILYICSPWINPSERQIRKLKYAFFEQQMRRDVGPDILVITRPPEDQPGGTEKGLAVFRELNAKIFSNRKVHSKLYIREPDLAGGVLLAIVGSQNLTRSAMLELGILIKGDNQIVNQLIAHFVDLSNISEEQ